MGSLPQSIILNIFSYLPYKFVRKTASLVCKVWLQISQDKSLIKYARDTEFSEVKAQNSSKETVDNFRQAVKWRPCLFQSIDLSGASTNWSTFCEIVENCTRLTVLNMARMQGGLSEYPVIRAINIVELNLSETKLDDSHLVFITESISSLGILNVCGCENLTDTGINNASFDSLRFLGLAHCKVGVDSIICAIQKHEIFAMCVEGVTLSTDDISHLLDLFPDLAEIGVPAVCGLPQGTVSSEALQPLCFYCRSSPLNTVLSVKESIDGSWMEL